MKSRDFTELFVLDSDTFLDVASPFEEVMKIYHRMRESLIYDIDYSVINIECYICKQMGHIAIDCSRFAETKKGNLIKLYNQVYKTNAAQIEVIESQSMIARRTPVRTGRNKDEANDDESSSSLNSSNSISSQSSSKSNKDINLKVVP